jgi:hypothetical protein
MWGFFLARYGSFCNSSLMPSVSKPKSASPTARMGLHDATGHRLYLTAAERAAFLVAAQYFPCEVRTLCVILHDTGCRVSEALAKKEAFAPDFCDMKTLGKPHGARMCKT